MSENKQTKKKTLLWDNSGFKYLISDNTTQFWQHFVRNTSVFASQYTIYRHIFQDDSIVRAALALCEYPSCGHSAAAAALLMSTPSSVQKDA